LPRRLKPLFELATPSVFGQNEPSESGAKPQKSLKLLAAGQSHASHQAAKPYLVIPMTLKQ
jgi:hypothetical protein